MLDLGFVRMFAERLLSVGEAAPGTQAEQAVASIVEEELTRLGMSVEKQEFTCASWVEESVHLNVDGKRVEAVAMPPTPSGFVEGELVHVGAGERIKAEGLEGKVALVGMTGEDPDYVAAQYALLVKSGASAVVFYDFAPRVLRRIVVGVFTSYMDGPGLPPPIPAVAIRREDALPLLKGKHYVKLEAKTRYREDARSLNLIAFSGEPRVLVSAHIDRWLLGAADDAVGTALVLALSRQLKNQSGVAFAFFGAEEYGAHHFNPMYWIWGSRMFVKRFSSTGELERLLAVINLDVAVRQPLTVSASGPEFREAARAMLGDYAEYDLDSAYFDSFSFSSAGVAALTIHSLWRYVELYHTDHDSLASVDWQAVEQAGGMALRIAGEVARKGTQAFKYDAWKSELLQRLERASGLLKPPAKLIELVKTLDIDESTARKLRKYAIKAVKDGEWYEAGILRTYAFPELLIVDDWKLIDSVERREVDIVALRGLRRRWTVGEVRELPSIPAGYIVLHASKERHLNSYLASIKPIAKAWLELVYAFLIDELEELSCDSSS